MNFQNYNSQSVKQKSQKEKSKPDNSLITNIAPGLIKLIENSFIHGIRYQRKNINLRKQILNQFSYRIPYHTPPKHFEH